MKNGTSSRPLPNPRALLEALQFQDALAYAQERQQEIFLDWLESSEEDLQATLRYESALLDETSDFLQTDESSYAILRLGSLLGTVESFERILYEQEQDQWAQARFQKETLSVKHLPEIVRALETHGAMYHSELSKYLGINPPTLTEAMKKIVETGAVQVSTAGKYKIYTLTDSGLRYGRELRKKKQNGTSLDEVIQKVQELLRNTNSEVESETIKERIRSIVDDRSGVTIYPKDKLHLSYRSPYDHSVALREFTIQSIQLENTRTGPVSLGGVMSSRVSKKRKMRELIYNDMEITEERKRA